VLAWRIVIAIHMASLCLLNCSSAGATIAPGVIQQLEGVASTLPIWLREALPKSCGGDPAKVVTLYISEGLMTTGGAAGRTLPPEATADLVWLKHFPHIKNLTLSGEFVTDTSLACLGCLTELERLDVSGSSLSGEGFIHCASLMRLKALSISGWRPSQEGFACLASLDNIEALAVNMGRAADGWVAQLGRMKSLNHLQLWGGFKPTPANLAGLRALARVQRLELLLGMYADDAALRNLGTLRNLSLLGLHGASITDDGLAPLERLPQLEDLNLRETKITDAGLAHVGCMKALRVLNLSATAISDDGLKHLASLGALEELDLAGTRIGDAGLAHLAAMKSLTVLDLQGTRVTEAGMGHLTGLTNLKRLDVTTDYLTEEETIKFVMDKDRVANLLRHIQGLRIMFWSRWEDENLGRWSPKGGAAPVLKPVDVSPDGKVSKWVCEPADGRKQGDTTAPEDQVEGKSSKTEPK
jgi:hypothetical protein